MNQKNGRITKELETVYICNGRKFFTRKEAEEYKIKPLKGNGYSIFNR